MFVSSASRNSSTLNDANKTHQKKSFRKKFLDKIDRHSKKIGYIPLIGTGIGIRRIYNTLHIKTSENRNLEIMRGSIEIICGGPLLLILDLIIKVVKKIIKLFQKDQIKSKNPIIQLPSVLKKESDKKARTAHAQKSKTDSIVNKTKAPKVPLLSFESLKKERERGAKDFLTSIPEVKAFPSQTTEEAKNKDQSS